ncbi:MAG TPA: M48 family metallopeptidase [Pseudonocardia sp.]|jgi:heat shock protein HtpX|nr:M48 family metallopeptidase [Pseudonocardia sp.]
MFDQVVQNKRRTALLIFLFLILTIAVFAAVFRMMRFGSGAIVLAVLFGGGAAFLSYWLSDRIALMMSHARPASPEEYARLHNLVEGLCIAGGLPKPRIYIVEDTAPNAFATGRNPANAAIAVTTGLLAKMNRAELEGVLAHELAHIKNYDILVSTLAVTMVGMISIVSDLSMRVRWSGGNRDNDRDRGGAGALLAILGVALLVAAPLLAQLMQFAVSRNRETLADFSGAELTRYPPGLISALEKLRDDQTVVSSHSRATAHLWIESPLPREKAEGRLSRLNKLFDTHPPLDERIAALRAL